MAGEELEKLRRLLREAGDSAHSLGDEPEVEPGGVGYFSSGSTTGLTEAIDAIASHDGPITMFVGAGVSAEASSPREGKRAATIREKHAAG